MLELTPSYTSWYFHVHPYVHVFTRLHSHVPLQSPMTIPLDFTRPSHPSLYLIYGQHVYVSICISLFLSLSIYIYVYIYIYIYVQLYVKIYICIYVYIHVCICMCISACKAEVFSRRCCCAPGCGKQPLWLLWCSAP